MTKRCCSASRRKALLSWPRAMSRHAACDHADGSGAGSERCCRTMNGSALALLTGPHQRHRDVHGDGDIHRPDLALGGAAGFDHAHFVHAHRHRVVVLASGHGHATGSLESDHHRFIAVSFVSCHGAGLAEDRGRGSDALHQARDSTAGRYRTSLGAVARVSLQADAQGRSRAVHANRRRKRSRPEPSAGHQRDPGVRDLGVEDRLSDGVHDLCAVSGSGFGRRIHPYVDGHDVLAAGLGFSAFKLVLFVLVDGWNLLVGSLVRSFA